VKLFIVGATGRTGRLLLDQAIGRGHHVTALVRKAAALKSSETLTATVGDPRDANLLAGLLRGHDVVISTLGQRSSKDATLLQEAAAAMLTALGKSSVRRYVVVSQGLLFPDKNPVVGLLRWFLARTVADSIAMEHAVRASDREWTIVRPPRLKEGGASQGYHVSLGARPPGAGSMQRADLATFLLDEAEQENYPRSVVGIN
jgi:putative NADH-flavin reductase